MMKDPEKHDIQPEDVAPDPEEFNYLHPIEKDTDALEPLQDDKELGEINADDPKDLIYWADQFKISVADLKAAIVLNGTSIQAIRKYLSV